MASFFTKKMNSVNSVIASQSVPKTLPKVPAVQPKQPPHKGDDELFQARNNADNACALTGNTVECIEARKIMSDISIEKYSHLNSYHDPLAEYCEENPEHCQVDLDL